MLAIDDVHGDILLPMAPQRALLAEKRGIHNKSHEMTHLCRELCVHRHLVPVLPTRHSSPYGPIAIAQLLSWYGRAGVGSNAYYLLWQRRRSIDNSPKLSPEDSVVSSGQLPHPLIKGNQVAVVSKMWISAETQCQRCTLWAPLPAELDLGFHLHLECTKCRAKRCFPAAKHCCHRLGQGPPAIPLKRRTCLAAAP